MRSTSLAALVATSSVAFALPLAAQDRSFNFAVRAGVATGPSYPGSDEYEAMPDLGFTFGSLNWGRFAIGDGIGSIPSTGFALRGAFNVVGSRKVDDNPELAGLGDIDTAVELGLGVVYRETNWQAFGEVRHGFGGHHGVVGTLGADLIYRPTERWTITAGPRLNLGNTEYAATYYGISAADAAASSFAAYDADGGILGSGAEIGAVYRFDNNWAFEGLLAYEKLRNSAADSPITANGSDDQWTLRLGFSRAFTLRF